LAAVAKNSSLFPLPSNIYDFFPLPSSLFLLVPSNIIHLPRNEEKVCETRDADSGIAVSVYDFDNIWRISRYAVG
jgi:hypothetical protein